MQLYIKSFFLFILCHSLWGDPLLVVVLMVKNEASVIEATLQPFIKAGVRDFVVFDTGSEDHTQEIAAQFFKQQGIENGHIVEEPFVDFATSRNRALAVTQQIFPDAVFMLMPDAEWYIHNGEALLQFCEEHRHDHYSSYLIKIQNDFASLYSQRLIRCQRNIHFIGRVHEVLNEITGASVPDTIYLYWNPCNGNKKSQDRWRRDLDLLHASYAENPFDSRTLFYLAQTYECLDDWENAYAFYTERATRMGWDEENFETVYRMGRVAEELEVLADDSLTPLPIQHYLKAFSMRPHRAEPLVQIADYYLVHNEVDLAFMFAARAVELPYPTHDILFVDDYLYDFVRYDILGVTAWYVGEYELGEWALQEALKREPTNQRVRDNVHFYQQARELAAN